MYILYTYKIKLIFVFKIKCQRNYQKNMEKYSYAPLKLRRRSHLLLKVDITKLKIIQSVMFYLILFHLL